MKETTLTEREMLIAKIGILSGIVAVHFTTPEKATAKLESFCGKHGFSLVQALKLEEEIGQMLEDSTLV